ncbi:putative HIT finger domain protein [Aspergillus melleus]|uniref:putative HIT finger domain protein n=1 Tax=Aspergillus melleus TaxID=138277 RepID=UPI001E8E477E|nr:uncharacterized protein LDX57_005286 [Aspergillus melleus]KAH8427572.1 hypothetical protein LDX57_005286 [Aspergillus melleus]
MYSVEVLPSSSTHLTPGWTYVPDRGFDPAKAAITPAIGRKRGIRDPGRADLSSRQTNAIVRHLAELDRENHRDVHIPVPTKSKDSGRGTRGKVTSNVRRILQSQKTFRNYLDDEEAALAQATTQSSNAQRPSIHGLNKITKPSSLRRSSTPATGATTTTPKGADSSARQKNKQSSARSSASRNTSTTPAVQPYAPPADEKTQTRTDKTAEGGGGSGEGGSNDDGNPQPEGQDDDLKHNNELIQSPHDNDPLLRSYIPSAPSERIMQALLAEPPLTYNASRAGPPMTIKSKRHFCCMCGYWGKIRCKNCHLRTCGLDCYKVHEDSRCGAFF